MIKITMIKKMYIFEILTGKNTMPTMYKTIGTSKIPDLYSFCREDLYPHVMFKISKNIPRAKQKRLKIENTILIPNISFGSAEVFFYLLATSILNVFPAACNYHFMSQF